MNERTLTRRRFALAAGSATVVGLAGCMDDEDDENGANGDNGDDEIDQNEEEGPELIITLENEDGEPVSSGVMIRIEEVDGVTTHNISEEIEGGEVRPTGVGQGDLIITVESLEDEFEPVEEEVTFEDEDEEVEFVLEGASADEEGEGEGEENGEEAEEEDDEDDEDD